MTKNELLRKDPRVIVADNDGERLFVINMTRDDFELSEISNLNDATARNKNLVLAKDKSHAIFLLNAGFIEARKSIERIDCAQRQADLKDLSLSLSNSKPPFFMLRN